MTLKLFVLLVAALAAPGWAQFSQLSTTDNGTEVYFISPLVLKGGPAGAETRLYRLGPDGLVLFAERGQPALPVIGNSGGISGPRVSGDGTVIGYTVQNVCTGLEPCVSPQDKAVVRGRQTLELGAGTLDLSRNGRWALVTPPVEFDPQTGTVRESSATLIDLDTGDRSTVPRPVQGMVSPAVASDGTVVVRQIEGGGAPGLWKDGQITPIQGLPGIGFSPVAIGADGGTLILKTVSAMQDAGSPDSVFTQALVARNLSTGLETPLVSVVSPLTAPQSLVPMGVSNDAKRVLYRVATPQFSGPAYIADTLGTVTPIELPEGELVKDGTLSGAGDTALLVTTKGRLLRWTLSTGFAETLIPATPSVGNTGLLPAGSFVRLKGSLEGSAADWTDRLLLNDLPLPVLGAQSGEVDVQIPWEARSGSGTLRFANPGDTPFETAQAVYVAPFAMLPETGFAGTLFGLKVVKGDFSELLTGAPAPGDVFHIYMTGLGPVRDPVRTGEPASVTAANPILGTLTCRFGATELETLFAGLAPGTIGFYQVSLRVPQTAAGGPVTRFGCEVRGDSGGGSFQVGSLMP